VFDLRYSGIFAVTAFVFSLLIGIVSRLSMPMLIIRPLIFAVIFFALAAFIKILVGRFLPELLEDANSDENLFRPGSRVNILEDDDPSDTSAVTDGFVSGALDQVPAGAKPDDSDDDLGDISELSTVSTFSQAARGSITAEESILGIDQNAKERYTDNGGLGDSSVPDFSKMFGPESSFEASLGGQARTADKGGANASAFAGAFTGVKTEGVFNSDETLPDLDSMAEAFMSDSSDEEPAVSDYSAPSPSRRLSSAKAPKWTEDFNAKDIAMGIRTTLSKDKEV
jgi:hypothetical protein